MSPDEQQIARTEWSTYWLERNEHRRLVANLLINALHEREHSECTDLVSVVDRVALACGANVGFVQNTLWGLEVQGAVSWTTQGFRPAR